ncbi:MAG: 3-dehydroquinate synthase II, partial [Deltaproteobacteria bacterium]|nr:3-dehydroquinate synthase II [Deltaproteobacteria bacterium]
MAQTALEKAEEPYMKEVWIKVEPWSKERVLAALEGGADAVLLPGGGASRVRELGIIPVISSDSDRRWGRDVVPFQVKGQEDVDKAGETPPHIDLVVEAEEWKVIAWENLVAKRSGIYALVKGYEEAGAALGALEKGVDGIVIDTDDVEEAKRIMGLVKKEAEKLILDKATITQISPLGL